MRINNYPKGFTLIELVVVIAIIGILAGLIIPNLLGTKGKVKEAMARSEIAILTKALALYGSNRGDFPPGLTDDSSAILVYCLQGEENPGWGTGLSPIDGSKLPVPPKKQYFSFDKDRVSADTHEYWSPVGFPYYYREYYSSGIKDGKFDHEQAKEMVCNRDGFDIWTAAIKTFAGREAGYIGTPEEVRISPIKICNYAK